MLPCVFSECTDEEALGFNKTRGCQGVREYLETGVFPERGKKMFNDKQQEIYILL